MPWQNTAFIFERMPKRNMSDVMQQRSDTRKLLLVNRNARASADRRQDSMRHPRRSERMLKSRVNSRGKNQIGRSELFDAPQTLEFGRIYKFDFQRPELDIAMNGVANDFRLSHTSYIEQ